MKTGAKYFALSEKRLTISTYPRIPLGSGENEKKYLEKVLEGRQRTNNDPGVASVYNR